MEKKKSLKTVWLVPNPQDTPAEKYDKSNQNVNE